MCRRRQGPVIVVGFLSVCLVLLSWLAADTSGGLGLRIQSASIALAADPVVSGQWSAPLAWPYIAVHGMLLNTGKVLTWQSGTLASVWDPATGAFTSAPLAGTDLL